MLPGKKYTPEDVLPILKRRFWLLIVPARGYRRINRPPSEEVCRIGTAPRP